MSEPSRYARLFESVKTGPVTAPNRFYQVPHGTGMGHALPQTLLELGVEIEVNTCLDGSRDGGRERVLVQSG